VKAVDAQGVVEISPDGTHFNATPKGWREVTSEEYAGSIAFSHEPQRVEYRQMTRSEGVQLDTVLMGNLEWYYNGTGTCICSVQEPNPKGFGFRPRLRFFLFGCDHEYRGMTQEEQKEHGVQDYAFNTHYFCPKCGHIECHDSSD